MKICRYNKGVIGLLEGDTIYPLGEALNSTGLTRVGATMTEVIEVLGANPAASAIAKARSPSAVALSSAHLLAPIENPPAIWAAAAKRSEIRL